MFNLNQEGGVSAEFSSDIRWDGYALYVEATTNSGPVTCKVPRDTVHVIRLYSDAIGREIHQDRKQILDKLAPFLRAKLLLARAGSSIELLPSEVAD